MNFMHDTQQNAGNTIKYDAFISYRHKELDTAAAVAIARKLETYRIPGYIGKMTGRKKMGKIFRDQDELPLMADLGEGIIQALDASEWLIVICTPDLPQSRWCLSEIDHFIKTGRRNRILTVLAAGEPEQSFPVQLRFERMPDGTWKEHEPLASDIRAESAAQMNKKLKIEKLRLLAPMFGVGFDDLRRRQRERVMRLIAGVSLAAMIFFAAFGAVVLRQNALLQRQMEETELQRGIAEEQRGIAEEQRGIAEEQRDIAEEQRTAAVTNGMHLYIEQSEIRTLQGNRLSGISDALKAYDLYKSLYPQGDDDALGKINKALGGATYTQGFQLRQLINNRNRLIYNVSYTPDGRYIIGLDLGGLVMIDAISGEILGSAPLIGIDLKRIYLSPSGKYFLTAEPQINRITIWNASPPLTKIAEYYEADRGMNQLPGAVFLSDDTVLIADLNNDDGGNPLGSQLIRWNFLSGEKAVFVSGEKMRKTLFTTTVAVSQEYAVCSLDLEGGELYLFRLDNGEAAVLPKPERVALRNFVFSPDGKLLAGLSWDSVIIWDVNKRSILLSYKHSGDTIFDYLLFSPDSVYLAIASDNGVRLIDVNRKMNKELVINRNREGENITSMYGVDFSPDSKTLIIFDGHAAMIYRLPGVEPVSDVGGLEVRAAAFSPDGGQLALGSIDGGAGVYCTEKNASAVTHEDFTGELYEYPLWHEEEASGNLFLRQKHFHDLSYYHAVSQKIVNSPDDSYRAVIYPDGCAEIWDFAKDPVESAYLLSEHIGVISCARMTSKYLITAGYDKRIVVFDLEQGTVKHCFSVGERIPFFELDPTGSMVIAATEFSRYAVVYDVESGQLLYRLEAEPGDSITKVGFTLSGDEVVAVQKSGRAIIGKLFPTTEELLEYANASLPDMR